MAKTANSQNLSTSLECLFVALQNSFNGNLSNEQMEYFAKIKKLLNSNTDSEIQTPSLSVDTLLNSSEDSLFLVDRNHIVLSLNQIAAQRMGGEIQDFLGKNVFSFFEDSVTKIRRGYVEKVFSHGKMIDWEDERNSVTFYNKTYPLKDSTGQVRAVAIVAKDISKQKVVEDDLKEKKELLATALDINNTHVWEVNLVDQTVSMYNYQPNIRGFKGPEQTLTVKESRNINHPDDRELVSKSIFDHLHGKTDQIFYEARILYNDGEYYWHSVKGRVVEYSNGHPFRILGLSTNIHDQKIAERERKSLVNQLFHSQKMEAIGRLAGGISHDFNNMLTAVIGQAELALLNTDPDHPVATDLKNILDAAQRAGTLAQQLLTISRKQKHNPKTINLNSSIKDILPLINRIIGDKINIELDLSSDLSLTKVDVSQLDQVLINLTVNARDAIDGKGTIFVATENSELDKTNVSGDNKIREGKYVLLSITDTGSGIPKEVQDKIFEPFFTTKPEGKGTGLGLATVYGIIEQNDGFIHMYSEVGTGTTFKVYLPILEKDDRVDSDVASLTEPPTGIENVLILEDDDAVRTLAIATLRKFGYTTFDARTSAEAQEIIDLDTNNIDLIIADVFLPDLNGPDFIRKNSEKLKHSKVVYISGYTSDFILDQHKYLGKIHFLGKPFRPIELLTTARKVLDE